MAWGDEHESEVRTTVTGMIIISLVIDIDSTCLHVCLYLQVLVGSVNGTVKTFSTDKGIFTASKECGDPSQGRFTGLAATDRWPHNLIHHVLFF